MAYSTYLILLVVSTFAAQNSLDNHLNTTWAGLEAVRYTYQSKTEVYNQILNSRETIEHLQGLYKNMLDKHGGETTAFQEEWASEFNSKLYYHFDRSLVRQSVCMYLYFKFPKKCDIGITWDHQYYPTPRSDREEFLLEIEKAIADKVDETYKQRLEPHPWKKREEL